MYAWERKNDYETYEKHNNFFSWTSNKRYATYVDSGNERRFTPQTQADDDWQQKMRKMVGEAKF